MAAWGFDEDEVRLCRNKLVPGIAPTTEDREAHSSIVLARLWRGPVADTWEWEQLEVLCGGSVGDYGPILEWIEAGGLRSAKPDFFQMDSAPYSSADGDSDDEGRSGWR